MTSAEYLSDVESLDAMDPWEGADALQELEDLADEFSELESFEAEGFEEDPFAPEGFEPSGFEDDGFEELFAEAEAEDAFLEEDGFDGFEPSPTSGLFVPATSNRLVSGPAAVTLARALNPFVLESMDADDAEAFFRGITRRIRGAARGIARGVRRAGQLGAAALRRAGPLIARALPVVQRVAGLAGPWGRVVAAGIGAAQGLLRGQGLRGALAGAVGGLIPGVGGRIASSVLRGDGADDDASLDALADMADARQVPAAVALPLGAGLAARVVTRQAVPMSTALGGAAQGVLRARTRGVEQLLMRLCHQTPGTAGRRLRLMRLIARLAAGNLRLRGPGGAITALPRVVRGAGRRVLTRAVQVPSMGVVPPRLAARRVHARRHALRHIPVSVVSAASVRRA
ncbi:MULTISPECIES: hypothetical protein [unclassified Corallococcus]|uniref:hypothetical protein n=1 Tax=unclassified Corallococcus TaxID=2685029 RepID=UPI001A8FD3EB|nr:MULTISPECIES: hypothetical protein [unclassified Corallococcus]MBN9682411.1 hypothetical protein [Corallococcus sp. NCSPR001]WAS86035.1 hypothetical protein O0N60_03460 [Corallococcus sp. NCRR]